jgi:hypothetical protein
VRHPFQSFASFVAIIVVAAGFALADPPVQSSQLVGSWVRTTASNMDGLEFTKDGKVLVYNGDANDAMTANYSVLDDGRLNISMGGQAQFFLPSMSGDQLVLKEPTSGAISSFRQLKSGETMASAITAAQQADQQQVKNRNAALPNFLAQQNLVLVFEGAGANGPPSGVLQFTNGNGYGGRAIFDGSPPHVDQISAQLQGDGDSPSVVISFLSGPEQKSLGQVTFRPAGTAPDITLTASVNFGEMFNTGPNTNAVIKPDANLYKQILDHAKAQAGRLNDLKAPVVAMLKDYAVLTGTSKSTLPSEAKGFSDQFTLSRNPQNQSWIGQGRIVNNATGATVIYPVIAQVGIIQGKAAIQLQTPKRLYLFTDIDTTGVKLSGAWQAPGNPNGNPADLAITQSLDAKARDQMFAANKTAVSKIDSKTIFHAVIGDSGSQPPNVVAASFSADAGGSITGKATYPLEGFTMTLSGKEVDTPMGPQLVLKYSNGSPNPGALQDAPNFITQLSKEVWILSPTTDSAGHMRLDGYAIVNPSIAGAAPITLQLIAYTRCRQGRHQPGVKFGYQI